VARTLNEGDHRLEGSLHGTVAAIRASGGEATAVAADISSEAECLRLVEAARAAHGGIDTLVNNAALNYYIPTADYPTSRWIKAFAVNVHAPFILSKAVLPDMIAAGHGAIVNIGSGSAIGPGRAPYADQTVRGGVMYGATKAALERFTQGPGAGGGAPRRHCRELRVAVAHRPDGGHRLSQADGKPRRSAR
jgi:NAD(P)-dependent dehydrogenase (short-subunit alcohol dehydrogenase family)